MIDAFQIRVYYGRNRVRNYLDDRTREPLLSAFGAVILIISALYRGKKKVQNREGGRTGF
jgi:hypothetical protein